MCNQFSLENRALLHKILPNPSMANFITRILLRSQNFQNTTLPLSAQCVMVHVSTLRQFWEKWHGWNQGYPNMALTLPFISQMVWIWAMTHKETMDLWVIIVCQLEALKLQLTNIPDSSLSIHCALSWNYIAFVSTKNRRFSSILELG